MLCYLCGDLRTSYGLVLSVHCMSPSDQIQVLRDGGKCLYQLSSGEDTQVFRNLNSVSGLFGNSSFVVIVD